MILTGPEIERQVAEGNIHIDPFDQASVGPNSYDVRLANKLVVYALRPGECLDMREKPRTRTLTIPPEGLVLQPGMLYLGSTIESAVSSRYVPLLEGRSSVGRLGISVHVTAGFGDTGWGYDEGLKCLHPTWTLEITVVHRARVYAGTRVAQVYFLKPEGDLRLYRGKYSQQKLPEPSRLSEDTP